MIIFIRILSTTSAKDKEIACLKEYLLAKGKEIFHLKERVSELEQKRQDKEIDFAKQMGAVDGELKKTKEHIFEVKENFDKKEADVETLSNELQVFNGE